MRIKNCAHCDDTPGEIGDHLPHDQPLGELVKCEVCYSERDCCFGNPLYKKVWGVDGDWVPPGYVRQKDGSVHLAKRVEGND